MLVSAAQPPQAASAAAPSDPPAPGATVRVGPLVYAGVSTVPVRDLPTVPAPLPLLPIPSFPGPEPAIQQAPARVVAPVQSTSPAVSMPSPSVNVPGLNQAAAGANLPPNATGDVGPNHYLQVVNTTLGIFDKAGNLLQTISLNDPSGVVDGLFHSSLQAECQTNNHGEAVVIYDHLHDRWLVADVAYTSLQDGPYYECIGISNSPDPQGTWRVFAPETDNPADLVPPNPGDPPITWLPSYAKFGLWPESLFMSANMYDCADTTCTTKTYKGVGVWAFKLDDLETKFALHQLYAVTTTAYFSLLPGNLRGPLPSVSPVPPVPPAPSDAITYRDYFVSSDTSSAALDVWTFQVYWGTSLFDPEGAFTGPTQISVASFGSVPATIPASGGAGLDFLGTRLMMQNQYRNHFGQESLWLAQTVESGGFTGIRWYQLDVTGGTISLSPRQSATYLPSDSVYRWLPSLAVDLQGNMAIGYSASSSSINPGIRYVGRLATDALNTLGQGESTLQSGTGSQTTNSGWGGASSMTVDPVDDCTFWYTNEYYVSNSDTNWQTRIGSFKYPDCGNDDVEVHVASALKGIYDIGSGETGMPSYSSLLDGPVRVIDEHGQYIFTSQAVTSGGSYNETMGVPPAQFTTDYWFPFYDHGYPTVSGDNVRTWILVGNPSDIDTAIVHIYIGGAEQLNSPFSVAPGSRVTPRWIGMIGSGPVHVSSDIPVFASEREFTVPDNSFSEMMGYPGGPAHHRILVPLVRLDQHGHPHQGGQHGRGPDGDRGYLHWRDTRGAVRDPGQRDHYAVLRQHPGRAGAGGEDQRRQHRDQPVDAVWDQQQLQRDHGLSGGSVHDGILVPVL